MWARHSIYDNPGHAERQSTSVYGENQHADWYLPRDSVTMIGLLLLGAFPSQNERYE